MPTPRRYQSNAERQAAYRARQQAARDQERAAKGLPASHPSSRPPECSL